MPELTARITPRTASATGASAAAIDALDKKLAVLEGQGGGFGPGGGGGAAAQPGLATLNGQMLCARANRPRDRYPDPASRGDGDSAT